MPATRKATGMWQRLRTRLGGGDDSGFTMAEIVISMTILSVVTLLTVSALTEIYAGTKRIDNVGEVRDQLDNSFRRLDKEIRYATWIGQENYDTASGAWTIRFATQKGCRGLKVSAAGDLSLVTWARDTTTKDNPMALASNIKPITGASLFTRNRANTVPSAPTGMGADYQPVFYQVRLYFNVQSGTVTLPFDATFTALNAGAEVKENESQFDDCTVKGGVLL